MFRGNVILLAEDDENDVFLVQRACLTGKITARLQVARDGLEALNYLLGHAAYADRQKHPIPYLVLLDLKLPKLTGFEILERIKTNGSLKRIPIVVMSASTLQSDVDAAYDLGANAYLVKPVDFDTLLRAFLSTAEFFTKHAARPTVGH